MDDNFSPRVKDVIAFSKEEALRLGHDFIGTEHLMLGLLRDGNGKAIEILNALDIDLNHLRRKVEILSPANPNITVSSNEKKNLHLTRQAERASCRGRDRDRGDRSSGPLSQNQPDLCRALAGTKRWCDGRRSNLREHRRHSLRGY